MNAKDLYKEDAAMAWGALGKTLKALWCDVLGNPEPKGEGPDHETVVDAVAQALEDQRRALGVVQASWLDDARRERDEARSLLIEEQQARHAAGTRAAQLEQSLNLLVNNTSPPPVARCDTDEEFDAAMKGRADTADWYRTRIKLALAAAAIPPSPAGASAPASGSTPAASSVTPSSSEVEGNPSAPRGTREGGAA